jgi:ubiquinone/menaquinone biosynthesis C-methylase UbiE
LLHDPDQLARVEQRLLPLLEEREVIEAIERDEVPVPATEDREYYYDQMHLNYWLSGLADLREVRRLVPNASLSHVLDFGGATGRFARHVPQAMPSATVTIADINHNHILWCNEYFGPAVRAVEVSQYCCHFPLPDNSVSLCVGLSVFTHIDRHESGWLAEMHRVLEPGGYAYVTIHSEDTWVRLPALKSMTGMKLDPQFKALYQAHPTNLQAERLVFNYQPGTIYHYCNTFFHTDYIRRVWGKWFDVVNVCQGWKKTEVVLKKS